MSVSPAMLTQYANTNQTSWQKKSGRGFTLIEILIVVMIIAISATVALGLYGRVDATQRSDRAAREFAAAIRYARMMAIGTGKTCGVKVLPSQAQFLVYRVDISGSSTVNTTVNHPMSGGSSAGMGLYQVDINSENEMAGCAIAVPTTTVAADSSGYYYITFNSLGTCTNPATVSMTYAGRVRRIVIPGVGEPTLN